MLTSEPDWRELAYLGRPVEAIQAYRISTGVSLAEAKESVERWQAINLPPSPSYQQCQRIGQRAIEALASYIKQSGRKFSYFVSILPSSRAEVLGQRTILLASTLADRSGVDLVVEVAMCDVSPRLRKETAKAYLDDGVRMVWIIESDDPTVHVYTDSLSHPAYHPGASFDGGEVLPGFACEVAELFG